MVPSAENSELSKSSETRMTASVLKQGPNNHKRLKAKKQKTKNRCLLGQFPVVLCSNKQCSFEPSVFGPCQNVRDARSRFKIILYVLPAAKNSALPVHSAFDFSPSPLAT